MLIKRMVYVILFLFLLAFNPTASHAETTDWILYGSSKAQVEKIIEAFPQQIKGRIDLALSGSFSEAELKRLSQIYGITYEPNMQRKAMDQQVFSQDPLSVKQWGFYEADIVDGFSDMEPVRNEFTGSRMTSQGSAEIIYDGQTLLFRDFSISFSQKELSRVSVTVDHVEGSWSLRITDENGRLLGENSGGRQTLDVLIPKANYQRLYVDVELDSGWNNPPRILNVTGVNHLLVAVIDSGVNEHEDFCGNVLFSLGKNVITQTGVVSDDYGHGTIVTGVLAACSDNGKGIAGALGHAPVDVVPVKVLNRSGYGDDFTISKAIDYALDLGAKVINLSLAGPGKTTLLEETVTKAMKQNVIVIAAAGNGGRSTEKVYPAAYPGVITVTASDKHNNILPTANYGWAVDLAAPGDGIISTAGVKEYKTTSGTSMAVPFVTAAAARILAGDVTADFATVRERLLETATDINEQGYDMYSGYGVLQTTKAIHYSTMSGVEILTLKDGQSLIPWYKQILAFSDRLIGKTAKVRINDKEVDRFIIKDRWTERQIPIDAKESGRSSLTVEVLGKGDLLLAKQDLVVEIPERSHLSFSDVSNNHWAYKDIRQVYLDGYLNGYTDGTFKPEQSISRRHSVMVLARFFNWPETEPSGDGFIDLDGTLSGYQAILSAYQQGVIHGYPNRHFYPDHQVTRGQISLMLARAMQLDLEHSDRQPHPFKDISVKDEEYNAVQRLTELGVFVKQEHFRPRDPVTRAQFAAMINRMSGLFD